MSLEERFQTAATAAKAFKSRPSDADMLQLYALYKQATVGDVNTTQPWVYQLQERAKWDAWSSKSGLSQDTAKEEYITLVGKLKPAHA